MTVASSPSLVSARDALVIGFEPNFESRLWRLWLFFFFAPSPLRFQTRESKMSQV